jgi:nucleotide-binding universal stress UspA family protein
MRQIMVATDGSEGGNRAVDVAAEIAKAIGGQLLIVTIGDRLSGEQMRQLARAEGNIADVIESISNQILIQARHRAERVGAPSIKIHAGRGDPAEEIIETARRENADVIVVGRRGRGRLTGLLLGSVSQKVVTLAPCVVIVVP